MADVLDDIGGDFFGYHRVNLRTGKQDAVAFRTYRGRGRVITSAVAALIQVNEWNRLSALEVGGPTWLYWFDATERY
jgi:hypothetical protein